MSGSDALVGALNGSDIFAGFWRRLFAFLLDCLLLFIVGSAIGFVALDKLVELGSWGRALGFVIAMAYFGLMDSSLCNGQTVGARLATIKVVAKNGESLPLAASFLRTVIFTVPYFANGTITAGPDAIWAMVLLSIIVGIGISIGYLFIFNRPTRQGLHDLAVGAYVVRADSTAPIDKRSMWRGHYFVIAAIMVASASNPLYTATFEKKDPFREMLQVQRGLLEVPGVRFATLFDEINTLVNTGATTHRLTVRVFLSRKVVDKKVLANTLAKVILDTYPSVDHEDLIAISLSYGYDIGIASGWDTETFSSSPADWRKKIDGKNL
jgi:uncharacterized RDD family membrane protein YckC